MTFDELQQLAEKDLKINDTELDLESLKTPQLHNKYCKFHNQYINLLKKATQDDGGLYSDATLVILTSKNNANLEVRFRNIYPTSLSGLDYNQQATDIDYLTATVTFEYAIYEFAAVGSKVTTETTT